MKQAPQDKSLGNKTSRWTDAALLRTCLLAIAAISIASAGLSHALQTRAKPRPVWERVPERTAVVSVGVRPVGAAKAKGDPSEWKLCSRQLFGRDSRLRGKRLAGRGSRLIDGGVCESCQEGLSHRSSGASSTIDDKCNMGFKEILH
ncbi:hypothetical protein SKAU_G00241960 [Synaphobranchus kaupii]|uniref:Uncharacterized protein n=1 Tax=Synaphobranchus kaupii TaxID=118154 RepID=A0A9Q1ITF7_SYNKA|nr:hypothetical protein SKAU_G00241960 [Synaphobranchus kaupii]